MVIKMDCGRVMLIMASQDARSSVHNVIYILVHSPNVYSLSAGIHSHGRSIERCGNVLGFGAN